MDRYSPSLVSFPHFLSAFSTLSASCGKKEDGGGGGGVTRNDKVVCLKGV